MEKRRVELARGRRLHAERDVDAGRAQSLGAAAGCRRRIARCRDDACHSGGDQCVGARRRLAEVRAGLERDVHGGAARSRAGGAQRLDLGVGSAEVRVISLADDVPSRTTTAPTIGFGAVCPHPFGERERAAHERDIALVERAATRCSCQAIRVKSGAESRPDPD